VSATRRKFHILTTMPAIGSDGIKIEGQIIRFDVFFMPAYQFPERNPFKKKAAKLPSPP
jgi:hypothetical protein